TDQDVRNRIEVYVVPIDGTQAPLKLSASTQSSPGFRLSLDGQHVLYQTFYDLWSVPIDGSANPIKLSGAVDSNGGVRDSLCHPDGRTVIYRSAQLPYHTWDFYRVPIDGSAPPVLLNDPELPAQEVNYQQDVRAYFHISAHGDWVVYSVGRLPGLGYDLYAVPTDGSRWMLKLDGTLPPGPSVVEYQLTR